MELLLALSVAGDSMGSTLSASGIPRSVGRSLLQVNSSGTRVLGVGVGVFVFAFFLILSIAVCFFGSRSKSPGLFYVLGALLLGVVCLVLFASPREDDVVNLVEGTDKTVIPRIIMFIIMCVAVLLSLVGILVFQVVSPRYARPLSYRKDVLGQKR